MKLEFSNLDLENNEMFINFISFILNLPGVSDFIDNLKDIFDNMELESKVVEKRIEELKKENKENKSLITPKRFKRNFNDFNNYNDKNNNENLKNEIIFAPRKERKTSIFYNSQNELKDNIDIMKPIPLIIGNFEIPETPKLGCMSKQLVLESESSSKKSEINLVFTQVEEENHTMKDFTDNNKLIPKLCDVVNEEKVNLKEKFNTECNSQLDKNEVKIVNTNSSGEIAEKVDKLGESFNPASNAENKPLNITHSNSNYSNNLKTNPFTKLKPKTFGNTEIKTPKKDNINSYLDEDDINSALKSNIFSQNSNFTFHPILQLHKENSITSRPSRISIATFNGNGSLRPEIMKNVKKGGINGRLANMFSNSLIYQKHSTSQGSQGNRASQVRGGDKENKENKRISVYDDLINQLSVGLKEKNQGK